MTARERFAETMRFGRPDHVPYLEEGLRDEVLQQWQQQGLAHPDGLAKMFGYDRREEIAVNLEARPPLAEPPTTRRAVKELRRRLDPDDPDRLPDNWPERVHGWRSRTHILQLPVHRGFFLSMGVHGWQGMVDALYLLKDQPVLVEEILNIYAEFHARLTERVLREVEVDCANFSEPVAGNEGPLLSLSTYRQFVLRSYRPVLDVLRRHGVPTIIYVSYANPRALLPAVVEAGFNCLWACEVNPVTMDYRAVRREFGRELRLIGGIDLDVLLESKVAIRREISTKVPPLLAQGGYIPLADGRVRANIPFEEYRYYRRLLREITRT